MLTELITNNNKDGSRSKGRSNGRREDLRGRRIHCPLEVQDGTHDEGMRMHVKYLLLYASSTALACEMLYCHDEAVTIFGRYVTVTRPWFVKCRLNTLISNIGTHSLTSHL